MSSDKKIESNRINSQKSTGPKTEEGKFTASKNSIKHGLLSNETLLPWENIQSLDELRERLRAALKPDGELEIILVDRVVSITWRLQRAGRIETGIFAWKKYSDAFDSALATARAYTKIEQPLALIENLYPAKEIVTDQVKYQTAMKEVSQYSAAARSEVSTLGRNFSDCADAVAKLSRYESSLEKSFFKALHELQRLQASRQGIASPLPIAIDVNLDSEETTE